MKPFILDADENVALIYRLKELIPYGARNAIRGKELAIQLGHYDDRKIRVAIAEMIERGIPIASSVSEPYGYYRCATPYEAFDYEKTLKSRIKQDCERLRDFKRACKKAKFEVPQQVSMI